jgi:hypothetical protein
MIWPFFTAKVFPVLLLMTDSLMIVIASSLLNRTIRTLTEGRSAKQDCAAKS